MIKRPTTKDGWLKYMACQAWFDKNGFLIINPLARVHAWTGALGVRNGEVASPMLFVVGQKARTLLVSADLCQVSQISKKYVRILGDEA